MNQPEYQGAESIFLTSLIKKRFDICR